MEYKLDELNKMIFALTNKKTNETFGNLTIDLFNPKKNMSYQNGYSVEILSYFPDFEFDENGEPLLNQKFQIIPLLSLR